MRARLCNSHTHSNAHIHIAIHFYLFWWGAFFDPYISVATHKMHPFLFAFASSISFYRPYSTDSTLSWRIHWMRLYFSFAFSSSILNIFFSLFLFIFSFSDLSCCFHLVGFFYAHKQCLNGKRQCQTLWLQRIVTAFTVTFENTLPNCFPYSYGRGKKKENERTRRRRRKKRSWP